MIYPYGTFFSTNVVGASFHFETLFSTQPINLVVAEGVKTPITYFIG